MDNWFVNFIKKYYRGRRYYKGIIFDYKLLSLEFDKDGGSAFICDGFNVEEVKIKFKQFTHHEKNILNEIISKEDIQTDLVKGIIPEKLFNLDFTIFPSEIDDISIDCTCYKTAMLCDEAVYLLYKISELFKDNPFLIFSLRGFDLEKVDEFPIIDIEDISTLNFRQNNTAICSKSLFDDYYYLLGSYLSEICLSLNNKLSEIVNRFDNYNILLEDVDLISLDVDSNYRINDSKILNEKALAFYLMKLDDNNSFLNEIVHFTKNLISDNKIIPQVFKIDDKYYTRWIPALFYSDIANSCKKYAGNCPKSLVTFNGFEISKENQIIIFISLFVKGLFEFMDYDEIADLMEDECYELFFKSSNNLYLASELSRKLSVFYMCQLPHIYLIEISDKNDIFKLDFKIRNENIIKSIDDASLDELRYAKNIQRLFLKFNINWKLNESIYLNKKYFIKFINKIKPLLDYLNVELSMPFKVYAGKFKLKLNVNVNSDDFFTISDLKDFKWEIEIGDNSISIEEFNKIPNNIEGIVKLDDDYFIVDQVSVNSLQNDIIFLPKKFKSYELLQIAILERYRNLKFSINDEFKKLLNFSTKVPIPKTLNATLRQYQEIGFSWLIHNIKSGFGSILADDMGLGKTIQVLTTILYLKENNHLKNKQVLIVAPTTLLSNWESEINKFTPDLTYSIYHGAMREFNDSEVILTSYSMVRGDIDEFSKRQWFLCVLDEAQNIKNPTTKQTKAVKSINALNRIALTGTPIENRLLDYWSIFDFTNPEYLSNRNTFKKEYANPISKNNSLVLDNLKKITNPFILRRLKTDSDVIKDLPDKLVNDIYCTLSKKQTKLYNELLSKGLNDLKNDGNGIKRKGNILKLITSLKQICNHPAQYLKTKNPKIDDSLKLELLVDMVGNILDVDEKVIIFTQYVQMGEIIKKILLKKFNNEVLFLHGSLKRDVREKIVNNFQNNSSFPILIATLKTGGVGLNLTVAQNVIHYDLWWNPAVENQATDRAYRIGQENDVMVYRFITKGTLEERIDDMIKDKLELAGKTIENQQTFITELSDEELKEILTLRL